LAWREKIAYNQIESSSGDIKLESSLLLPNEEEFGKGPYPVLVFSHGDVSQTTKWVQYKVRIRDMVVAREFLKLGMAVVFPARRGVGLSDGKYPRGYRLADGDPTFKARLMAQDVWPVLRWLKDQAELDASKIIVAGQSAGGYLSMYIASENPVGVVGAIDFSGGRTDIQSGKTASYHNEIMINGFADFGKTARIPTLWIFAENDSRYTASTIKQSYQAFVKEGGKAELFLNPPIDIDGHFIYHRPNLWREKAREFLTKLGMVR
jgi:dienelactone hydrolase